MGKITYLLLRVLLYNFLPPEFQVYVSSSPVSFSIQKVWFSIYFSYQNDTQCKMYLCHGIALQHLLLYSFSHSLFLSYYKLSCSEKSVICASSCCSILLIFSILIRSSP